MELDLSDFTDVTMPNSNMVLLTSPSLEEPTWQMPVAESPEIKFENVKIEDETDFRDITGQNFVFVDPLNLDMSFKTESCSDKSLQGEVDPLSMKQEPSESLTSTAAIDKETSFSDVIVQKKRLEFHLGFENEGCFGINRNPATQNDPTGKVAVSTSQLKTNASQGASTKRQITVAKPLATAVTSKEAGGIAKPRQRMPAPTQREDLRQNELCGLETAASGSDSLQSLVTSEESDDKPYSCTLCSYTCKWKCVLVKHMTKHARVKLLCCTECNYKTALIGNLKRHFFKHTGVKKFCCTECNYTTADGGALKRHMLKHSSVESYTCPLCSYYMCTQKRLLEAHMTKHTGVKPFCGNECN